MERGRRAVGALALLIPLGCAPAPSRTAPASPVAPPAAPRHAPSPEALGYVGSRVCKDCHEDNFTRWSRDWHPRALSRAAPETVAGNFADQHFHGASSEAWMRRSRDGYVVRTRDREGAIADYPVSWVVGGKRMQDPLTVLPDGRFQVLPIYYHVTGKGEWVDYNETKQGPVGPDHPFFWTNFRRTANHECLDCHATGLSVSYDPTSRTFATAFADPGVACECCHGPGGKHAASLDPKDVVHPGKVAPELGLAICAQCHGARLPHFPVLDAAHRYRPGQPYADAYDPIAVTDGSSFLSDFYADGRPRVGSDEYLALLQSRCYMKGGATCLTCHTPPHAEHQGPDELRLFPAAASIDPRDAACRGCHADLFLRLDAHTHHRAREARTCVACHMPPVVSGVLDQLADHAIDVPAPGTTIRHGVPNACNACHEQATPQEMEAALYRLWPDAARRTERRRRLADAFDVATAATSESSLEAVLADGSEAETLRAAAASLLASRIKERAREPLLAALSDPSPLVRSAAASGLSWAGPGVAPSLRPLLADPSTAVELAAAATLIASDDPEAEALYRRLAGAPATSGLVDPHIQLGLLDARRQRLAEAETELRTAIDLQFYNTYALVKLADVYMVTGRRQLAEATANEALRFDPQDREARKRLGR